MTNGETAIEPLNISASPPSTRDSVAPVQQPRRNLAHKLAVVVPFALLLMYILGWYSAVAGSNGLEGMVRRTDFVSTLTGALILSEGSGPMLYDLDVQRAAQNHVLSPYSALAADRILPYNHLPFEALAVTPLMSLGLPYSVIFAFWTLLMALALFLSLRTLHRALPLPAHSLPLVLLALCSYQPLFRSFLLGQNSPLVLLGLCATYASLKRGHEGWAGISLLLVALKPQILPVVLLLLLVQRHWKALATFAASLTALCISAMLFLGTGWPWQYAQLLLGVANWRDTGAIDPSIMHNWRGFAANLFADSAPSLITPLFASLSLLSVALLLFATRFWIGLPLRDPKSKIGVPSGPPKSRDLLWALSGVVAVLTSLHLNPHDLTLLIFPAWIIAAHATSGQWGRRSSRLWLSVLWAAYALIPLTFYLPTNVDYPGLAVIPSVLLMATSAILLTFKINNHPAAQPL